ncbi:hypothetical protein KVR01_002884 [Diaporthe batatas]|uniref:uncharacterized protein n=1 Tax=Diaporthe batatas TaxID=748121 RepID=UPI001D03E52F|nr:uncharacterized protein KVR01_002884 [Diaporthe batatas]KAG8167195.1 hypothetical protein KVR01_002884 [Diaporthe batatas]
MPSPRNHLQDLEAQAAILQGLVTSSENTDANLSQACRDMHAEFNNMNKKHMQLAHTFEKCTADLWSASARMDSRATARVEERMEAVIEEQIKIQRLLPKMYRELGEMVGARDSTRESTREYKDRVTRKMEEIHTLKPCQSLNCGHCGRGGAAALHKVKAKVKAKVKVNFKDRVARIWRAQ